jgi:hypothetical protein
MTAVLRFPNDAYGITKFVNAELLYIHYRERSGYSFKTGRVGAAIFRKEVAEEFMRTMFGSNSSVMMMKMKFPPDLKITTGITQHALEISMKAKKRRDKRRIAKKKAHAAEFEQGPDVAELPVAPTTF